MEERDLIKAKSFLAEGFQMEFPGGEIFTDLSELVDWGKERYQSVTKDYEHFDELYIDNIKIVYCYGFLRGNWLNGSSFSGIRFIDRFMIKDDQIFDQKVWNDLSEFLSKES